MEQKRSDVVALGELLIDFTENGLSGQGNLLFEANPGGAPSATIRNLMSFSGGSFWLRAVWAMSTLLAIVRSKLRLCRSAIDKELSISSNIAV